jgi:hypothetical protein
MNTARNQKPKAKIETRTEVAVSILWSLDPTGRHDLAAIDPFLPEGHPGKIEAATFGPSQRGAASAWIEARQGSRNLYTSVNRAAANAATNARLAKKDIGTLLAVVLDIDPTKIKDGDPTGENFKLERARLLNLVSSLATVECPPTLVVDSGGGYQAWWQLAEPLRATAENVALVEGIGRTIQQRYGGDSIWDASRIMRLPGTINVLSPDKAAQGRAPTLASVLPLSTGVAVTLDALRAWAPPTALRAKPNAKLPEIDMEAICEADDYAELPLELRKRFEAARDKDPVLDKLWNGTPAKEQSDTSPSGYAFALAGRLGRAGGFTATEFGMLLLVWDQRSEKEIDARYITRAWANNAATVGGVGFESVPIAESSGAAAPAEWGEPTDLWSKERIPAELPVGVLPDIIENQAREMARGLGVNAGAPAAVLVTVLGSMIPASNVLQMRQLNPGWTEPPITWTAIVGPPGSNKSGTIKAAVSFLKEIEKGWQREFTVAKTRHNALERRSKKSSKPKRNGERNPPSGADLGEPIASTDDVFEGEPLAPAEAPRLRRKMFNDATIEEIASVLSHNPDGGLQLRDEISGWLSGMDAYRPGKSGKDRAFWLEAKEGGSHLVDRKTADLVIVENLAVSVLGGIQPDKLRKIGTDLLSDGLLQRFATILIRRLGRGDDFVPDTVEKARLGAIASAISNAGRNNRFLFSPGADRELDEIEAFKAREIELPTTSPALAQWLEKLPKEFGRMSLISHYIGWYASADCGAIGGSLAPPPELVSQETAQRARRYLTEFVYSHVRVLYQSILTDTAALERHTVWIAGFILARQLNTIDRRTIERAYKAILTADHRSDIGATMHSLERLDWVKPIDHKNGVATEWAINPAAHDGRFAEVAQSERNRRGAIQEKIKQGAEGRRDAP